MIDSNNTYFLVQGMDSRTYRLPFTALGDMVIFNSEENSRIQRIIEAIYDLSSYLLELSSEFIASHYSKEEISANFELIENTNDLLVDKSILDEKTIDRYISDKNIITKDDVDVLYDAEENTADTVFDKVADEADKFY